jgi:hypothetical protein
MFGENVHLEDVLLTVALGHGLAGSKSLLTMIPKDIVQRILAQEIEKCYWNSRLSIGLLTPQEMSVTRCNQICGKLPYDDLEFRRAPIVSCGVQAKENLYVPVPKSNILKDLTAPTISRFIANRFTDLLQNIEPSPSHLSTNGALARRASSPRKVFRRLNNLP